MRFLFPDMIPEELMRQVRRLEIMTSRAVNEAFAGEYQSAFRGRGMEFDEVREYQPGDDVRSIDWNVTARTGRPFIKRYVEERELNVVLMVDLSASGAFGTAQRLKKETATELAAVLAFAATRKNDRISLVGFTDEVELFLPPRKGRRHVLRVIRELVNFEPVLAGTNIAGALEHVTHLLNKRSVIFLISDFLDDDYERPLRLLHRRHDVVALRVVDPREETLPPAGLIDVIDAEQGRIFTIDASSPRVRRKFAADARARAQAHQNIMRRLGVDHATITSGEPYTQTLLQLFRRREHRR